MAPRPADDLPARLAGARHDVDALLASDRSRVPWTKLVPVAAALLVAAGLGWAALAVLRPHRRAAPAPEPAVAVERSQLLPPLAVTGDGDELTAPFEGFAVSIDTDPPGGKVTVGPEVRGDAPLLAGVPCAPGEPVELTATLPGGATVKRVTTCRKDTLVKLTLRAAR
jgi:hypothetical protein